MAYSCFLQALEVNERESFNYPCVVHYDVRYKYPF